MQYRLMGSTGLRSSVLAFGNASMHGMAHDDAVAIVRHALDAGITHFDTAESYGGGMAETMLADILHTIGIARDQYILATKAFTYGGGVPPVPPHQLRTLDRKYLFHAIDQSLTKLGTDHVDIFYCHQMADDTPIEETVDAMDDIVRSGKARYWAVSNWDAASMTEAADCARRRIRHRPILNQIEHNLLYRSPGRNGLGAAQAARIGYSVWGPLAGGLLTGKYLAGAPASSRAATLENVMPSIAERLVDPQRNAIVREIADLAREVGCSVAQLSIAWCLMQPNVSTVLTTASGIAQLDETLAAVDMQNRVTPDIQARYDTIVGNYDRSNIPAEISGR